MDPDDPLIIQIRELSRIHEDLWAEENRLMNRLREQVHRAAIMGTFLAEAAPLLIRRDVATLRAFAGSAPITRRSGERSNVQMRRACNPRLRNAFYHWARVSTTCDPASRAYYAELRSRGHTHGRALRSVADRWIRSLMAMLRDRTRYRPDMPGRSPGPATASCS